MWVLKNIGWAQGPPAGGGGGGILTAATEQHCRHTVTKEVHGITERDSLFFFLFQKETLRSPVRRTMLSSETATTEAICHSERCTFISNNVIMLLQKDIAETNLIIRRRPPNGGP